MAKYRPTRSGRFKEPLGLGGILWAAEALIEERCKIVGRDHASECDRALILGARFRIVLRHVIGASELKNYAPIVGRDLHGRFTRRHSGTWIERGKGHAADGCRPIEIKLTCRQAIALRDGARGFVLSARLRASKRGDHGEIEDVPSQFRSASQVPQ
jgi:hypothetical protein